MDFALGDAGQAVAKEKGFVDLVPQIMEPAYGRNQVSVALAKLADDRTTGREDLSDLMSYARWAVNGNRVTVTFRFQTGSAELDSRAVRDLDRLATFLQSPMAAQRTILAVGFTDSVGLPQVNRELSERRAKQIANQLQSRGVKSIQTAGFGRVAPVACNTTSEGQQKNRRVEIWLN